MNRKKLLINERVEVRQLEEGLGGAWYAGVVISVSDMCRSVQYDELLTETEDSKLVENIPVTDAIEGIHRRHLSRTYRGHIRPLPPISQTVTCKSEFSFGVCVDAWFEDAWWEGVIFDCHDDADERSVFFPDENDECVVSVTNLRISRDWDEYSDVWSDRGVWILVELGRELKVDLSLTYFIKTIWPLLRENYGFQKMVAGWPCGAKFLWKQYLCEVINEVPVEFSWKGSANNLGNRNLKKNSSHKTSGSKPEKTSSTYPLRSKAVLSAKEGKSDQTLKSDPVLNEGSLSGMKKVELEKQKYLSSEKTSGTYLLRSKAALSAKEGKSEGSLSGMKKVGLERQKSAVIKSQTSQFPDSGSANKKIRLHNGFHELDPLSHEELKTQENIAKYAPIVAPSHCRKPRSKRVRLCFKRQIKCSSVRRRFSVSQEDHQTSDKTYSPLEQRDKGLDSATSGKFPMHVKSKAPTREQKKVLPSVKANEGSLSKSNGPTLLFDNFEKNVQLKNIVSPSRKRKRWSRGRRPADTICIICHSDGDLILCERCRSSYHLSCIDLKDVPNKSWCCPACCCGLCGLRSSATDDPYFLNICLQCSREYHVDCLDKAGGAGSQFPVYNSCGTLCSETCYKMYAYLHQLLGTSKPTAVDGISWTMLRSRKEQCNIPGVARVRGCKKLSQAFAVIHECFEPSIEPHTQRDLAKEVVYSSVSRLRRLNFHGFYAMALEKDDDVVCVATVRIHGRKVAEMPLIATHFRYRRQGMCRLLVNELEKLLTQMHVERLVLPAISDLRKTWQTAFGFREMSHRERMELSGYPLLGFKGTAMFQKYLGDSEVKVEPADNSPFKHVYRRRRMLAGQD